MNPAEIRQQFARARATGLRAREAAESLGLSEGSALAAHTGEHEAPLKSQALRPDWLKLLESLEACGPLMALTRNDSVVHEKTGIYSNLSQQGQVGMALGADIDLRLFFSHWHAGMAVAEPTGNPAKTSLQFFDRHGSAVHKIFTRESTHLGAWARAIAQASSPEQAVAFDLPAPGTGNSTPPKPPEEPYLEALAPAVKQAWRAMTDTHQFFGLLRRFELQRQQAFRLVEKEYAHRVQPSAVREMLMEAAFAGLPIMCFVSNPGCIQIHSGPVERVEPMTIQGKAWLNVLDPGFNLHLREDLIAEVWVVEKPTSDGIVTSLEVFDAQGGAMAMFFGARKPGQAELPGWRVILGHLQETSGVAA